MSFDIHAAGTEHFVYRRERCADGDVFEAMQVISALQATSPSRIGVGEGVADYVLPSTGSQGSGAAQAHGATIWRQTLQQGLVMLSSNRSAVRGWVSVSAVQSTLGFRSASAVRTYRFGSGGSDPPVAFMRTIVPVLTQTHMNNYGVLREMANAIWRYRIHIGDGGPPMLSIQLRG
jgi:hypothetical protein